MITQSVEIQANPDRLDAFLPDSVTLASFLVNALYLFGDSTLIAHGGAPAEVTSELTKLGHRVASAPLGRSKRSRAAEGRHDRALLLTQALGRGSDAEILERLRTLRRAVRPGGLICFHIFDRDRAWILAGESVEGAGDGDTGGFRFRFDPATGRISALPMADWRRTPRVEGQPDRGRGGRIAVKAWNRSEIETLLRGAVLKLERVYGDWDGTGPDAGAATGRLIVVAAKPRRARRPAGPSAGRSRQPAG